ncbi:hypothetical protein CGH46_20365, partial [Vibrio parahaemolyticus]
MARKSGVLIMKNITIIALSLVVAACSSSSERGDEYDYIDTPIA